MDDRKIVTITSYKGGVGKTTTAIHLSCFFQQRLGETLLIDGDPNRSCLSWSKRGTEPFPVQVVDEKAATRYIPKFQHLLIDTPARPDAADLEALAEGCDLLILPTTPDALSLDALMLNIAALEQLKVKKYRVLITAIPPHPNPDGDLAREALTEAGVPLFKKGIRRMVAFQRASQDGVPVYAVVGDSRRRIAWRDYEDVGEEVLEILKNG